MFAWAEDPSCKFDSSASGNQGRNGGSVIVSPLVEVNESIG